MAQFTKNSKRNPLERSSSQGLVLGCPICAAKLDLLDTRDGDQAYWCHRCQSGWRAGNLPEAAHRSKDSAIPAPQVQAVTPAVETPIAPNTRAKPSRTQPRAIQPPARQPPATQPRDAQPSPPIARQTATPIPTRAKPLAAEVTASERGRSPRAPASEPKNVAFKPVAPRKSASSRAADVTLGTPNTAVFRAAQKKPSLETGRKDSRRAAQIVAPVSKPPKVKRPLLEETAAPDRRTPTPQTGTLKSPERAASGPQPKRTKRSPLETAVPLTARTPRTKRSQREQPVIVVSGKGSRKPAASAPQTPIGKRHLREGVAKPKASTPRVTAQRLPKKTLETVAPTKTLLAPAKPSRREKPTIEISKGSRKTAQTAAPAPKAATGKRSPLQAVTPKISGARAASQKPPKKRFEAVSANGKKTRQPTLEPTPRPRRASARAAPEQRKSRNVSISKAQTAPVSQPRARRQNAPLEPITKLRRAAQGATQPKLTRAAQGAKQPVAAAPRPKPSRSSPARSAPANPVQFGLFDALPMKTATRRSAK